MCGRRSSVATGVACVDTQEGAHGGVFSRYTALYSPPTHSAFLTHSLPVYAYGDEIRESSQSWSFSRRYRPYSTPHLTNLKGNKRVENVTIAPCTGRSFSQGREEKKKKRARALRPMFPAAGRFDEPCGRQGGQEKSCQRLVCTVYGGDGESNMTPLFERLGELDMVWGSGDVTRRAAFLAFSRSY